MATYNCTDSTDNTYGGGSFGTCTGQSVGAPNTGIFEQVMSGGTFTVLLPLIVAIVLTCVAALLIRRTSARRHRDR
jgi:ribose/xylose/arabinose/galactoside ABC-type transport system permease subunit